jgi:prepilin-type N-terminal cleavage/methylation domain-containing protein
MSDRRRARQGFTLIELLVVITIIGIAMAMIALLPRGAKADAEVSSAAEELASTLRLARSLAMDHRAMYGVTFNISNAPGTSGAVLNNWKSGHWYRILAPTDGKLSNTESNGFSTFPLPQYGVPLGWVLQAIKGGVGDRHVLPQRKVRFLALSDQDNGGSPQWNGGGFISVFPATYPRPWFGYYDQNAHILYPWGGYNPNFTGLNGQNTSAFCYQGHDGPIVGSTSPTTRVSTDGTNYQYFTAGTNRAVVNGDWEDYMLYFLPNGDVMEGVPQLIRMNSPNNNLDLGDLTTGSTKMAWHPQMVTGADNDTFPNTMMTSYVNQTGFYSITLGPDALQDTTSFPSTMAAYQSIMPAYRVMINRVGVVKTVKVRGFLSPTAVFDNTIQGAGWQNQGLTQTYYQYGVATTPTGITRATPVSEQLSPDLLALDNWWLSTP